MDESVIDLVLMVCRRIVSTGRALNMADDRKAVNFAELGGDGVGKFKQVGW